MNRDQFVCFIEFNIEYPLAFNTNLELEGLNGLQRGINVNIGKLINIKFATDLVNFSDSLNGLHLVLDRVFKLRDILPELNMVITYFATISENHITTKRKNRTNLISSKSRQFT